MSHADTCTLMIKQDKEAGVTNFKKSMNTACETKRDILVSEDVEHPPTCKKTKESSESCPTANTQNPVIVDDITNLDMSSTKVWVQFGRKVLTETDKDIVMFGKKLTDRHKNFSQSLL